MRKNRYYIFRFDFYKKWIFIKIRFVFLLIGLCYINTINSQEIKCSTFKCVKNQNAFGFFTKSNEFNSKIFNMDYNSKNLINTVFVDFKIKDRDSNLLKNTLLITGIGFCLFGFYELGKAYSPGGTQRVGDPSKFFVTGLISGGLGTGLLIWSYTIE